MRIATHYAHLNGLEYLMVRKKRLWREIRDVIASVDAEECKTKISKERRTKDRLLYSPIDMNKAMHAAFDARDWGDAERRIGSRRTTRSFGAPC